MKKIWFILFCLPLLSCFGRELEGFNAIVTGGSRGIGEASAYALAREGANVAIAVDKSLEEGAIVVDNLKALGVDALLVQCDVSNPNDVERLVAGVVQQWRSLDIFVNNRPLAYLSFGQFYGYFERILSSFFEGCINFVYYPRKKNSKCAKIIQKIDKVLITQEV